jgi:hypothetical protein
MTNPSLEITLWDTAKPSCEMPTEPTNKKLSMDQRPLGWIVKEQIIRALLGSGTSILVLSNQCEIQNQVPMF